MVVTHRVGGGVGGRDVNITVDDQSRDMGVGTGRGAGGAAFPFP